MATAQDTRAALDQRVDRLRGAARDAGLDAVVVTSDASLAYFSGLFAIQLERMFALAVRVDGPATLVVPRLEEEAAGSLEASVELSIYEPSSDGMPNLVEALAGSRAVGVEEDHLVFARAQALAAAGLELRPGGAVVMGLRVSKDDEEIERIRHAVGIVESELTRMFESLQPGSVEWEVNARIDSRLRERGATDVHPLILFGANAANPHGKPGDRTLQEGDIVCADVSARFDGYWADLTRCASAGEPTEWSQAAWTVVADAQAAAIEASRVGAPARAVDAAQRRIVEGSPELGACLHGAGHALGLDIHEPPFLTPRFDTPLESGAVLTIEPGIYQTGRGGIRIEDVVVVTDDGPLVLSTLPRELAVPSSFARTATRSNPGEENA